MRRRPSYARLTGSGGTVSGCSPCRNRHVAGDGNGEGAVGALRSATAGNASPLLSTVRLRLDEAEQEMERLFARGAQNEQAYLVMGQVKGFLGKADEAIGYYEDFLALPGKRDGKDKKQATQNIWLLKRHGRLELRT